MNCVQEAPQTALPAALVRAQPSAPAAKEPRMYNVGWEAYDLLVQKLAQTILDSGWEFDQIVCIARGGLLAGLRLSHLLKKENLGVIVARSYEGEKGMQQNELNISTSIAMMAHSLGKRILLVDDLVDSGITLDKVKKSIKEKHAEVKEIRTAVLWEKTCSAFHPDYVVEKVDAKTWINQPFEKM